jgi:hypothetical protein
VSGIDYLGVQSSSESVDNAGGRRDGICLRTPLTTRRVDVSNADVRSVPPTLPPPEVIVRLFAPADALLIASHFIDTALTEYQSVDRGHLKIMVCSAACNHQ